MIGFGEPAQHDEIAYHARPDFNGYDRFTLPAAFSAPAHSLRTRCDARIIRHCSVLVLFLCPGHRNPIDAASINFPASLIAQELIGLDQHDDRRR
jgi:hypothetical protein